VSGTIPSLPNTPSWRGAQLKHGDSFTFYLLLMYNIFFIYKKIKAYDFIILIARSYVSVPPKIFQPREGFP
jgi:hypothetical protein